MCRAVVLPWWRPSQLYHDLIFFILYSNKTRCKTDRYNYIIYMSYKIGHWKFKIPWYRMESHDHDIAWKAMTNWPWIHRERHDHDITGKGMTMILQGKPWPWYHRESHDQDITGKAMTRISQGKPWPWDDERETWQGMTLYAMTRHARAWHFMWWRDMTGHDMTLHVMTWLEIWQGWYCMTGVTWKYWRGKAWKWWHGMKCHLQTWRDIQHSIACRDVLLDIISALLLDIISALFS